jgi:hypothetical protein
MAEIVIETKVRGKWKRYESATVQFKGEPEGMAEAACRAMAEVIVEGHWPGGELRCRWDEGGGEITLLVNDPLLDEFVIEERERVRAYAESQRYALRSA